MPITSMNEFNALQKRVLAEEEVSIQELNDAVEWMRRFRKTELPSKTTRGASKAPVNLDQTLKDLGL